MKYGVLLISSLFVTVVSFACDVCSRQQPKVLKSVAHGAGPDSSWDYVIVIATTIVVVAALVFSIRWLLYPGEQGKDHIKYSIFNEES